MNTKQIETILSTYSTPLYVFDIKTLYERIDTLKKVFTESISLCYAMKANTFVLPYLKDSIDRFEVCSPGEFRIFQSLNLPYEKLVLSGVAKERGLIEECISNKYAIFAYTVESLQQFNMLDQLASQYHWPVHLFLRLTSGNQFGINKEEIVEIANQYKNHPYIKIKGIQYFSGTQKNSLKRLQKEIHDLDTFIMDLNIQNDFMIEEFEYGPGLPVAYFPTDVYDEQAHLIALIKMLTSMTSKVKVTLEIGRSLVASCGTYYTKVVDTKTNKGQNYAIVDGGIHHLVYYGQSMAMKHPFYDLYPKRETGQKQNWNLCGSLCTVNDILVKQLPIQDLKIDDTIIFKNTGAYCMTEGINLFLSRDLPQVVLQFPNEQTLMVREPLPTYTLNTPNIKQ